MLNLKNYFYKKNESSWVATPGPANGGGARPLLFFFQITFNAFHSYTDLFYQYNSIFLLILIINDNNLLLIIISIFMAKCYYSLKLISLANKIMFQLKIYDMQLKIWMSQSSY
jgi:hypothetical protein